MPFSSSRKQQFCHNASRGGSPINRILNTWWLSFKAVRFTTTTRLSMDGLPFELGHWSDRCLRQKLQALSPAAAFEYAGTDPNEPVEPVLPTPTDVPVPSPHDVPVPEPHDVPVPEPLDIPPP